MRMGRWEVGVWTEFRKGLLFWLVGCGAIIDNWSEEEEGIDVNELWDETDNNLAVGEYHVEEKKRSNVDGDGLLKKTLQKNRKSSYQLLFPTCPRLVTPTINPTPNPSQQPLLPTQLISNPHYTNHSHISNLITKHNVLHSLDYRTSYHGYPRRTTFSNPYASN